MTEAIHLEDRNAVENTLDFLIEAARQAGRLAFAFFAPGAPTRAAVETKSGGSPVTEADLQVNRFLEHRLRPRFASAAWLSEESADCLDRLNEELVLIVDPIDGTRGFVAGDPHWTICIALVQREQPVLGVVHAPALDETYAAARGYGATLNGQRIAVSARESLAGARAAGPKPLAAALAASGSPLDLVPKIPSLAYRVVQVARGTLDLALASGDSHDWDIAAADVILHEAGGLLTTLEGLPIRYNQRSLSHGRLCAAPAGLHRQVIAIARSAIRPAQTAES